MREAKFENFLENRKVRVQFTNKKTLFLWKNIFVRDLAQS